MRQILASLTAFFVLTASAAADETRISEVIHNQIEAFLADDFETAFTYASPNIKRLFGTPQRFGQMVRDGYPMVHRPAEVTMLETRPQGERVEQRVLIRDEAGRLHLLAYQMIDTLDGWQINGVQILRAPDVGT